MGTNLLAPHSCGICGLPIEKTCLCRVYPHLLTPIHLKLLRMPNKLVLLLLLPVVGWFCMNTMKMAKNELFLCCVYTHLQMCIRLTLMPTVCKNISFR